MKKLLALITGAILLFGPGCLPSPAQIGSQVGQVSCKVIGPDGQPLIKVPVVYTNPETGRSYKLKTDKRGEAMGLGLMFGTYQVVISNQAGEKLYDGKTYVGPDQDANAIKIDLSRPASESRIGSPTTQVIAGRDPNAAFGSLGPGIPNMASVGPVDNKKKSKQQEKDQLAKASATNDLIKQVNVALSARKWSDAATGFQRLIQADPAKLQYYQGLGAVQINLGQYQDAAATFDKGIQIAQNASPGAKADPQTKAALGEMLMNEGNAYLRLNKTAEATAAYEKAAAYDPDPVTAYFNLCATQYNAGNMDSAVTACDKVIAADPTKADAYFIKGTALYRKGKLDSQGKYTGPAGAIEALTKYLQLAPGGQHADDVKAMLKEAGVQPAAGK